MFFIPSQIIHNSYLWNEYKTKSPKQINHICRTTKLSSKTNINMMTKCCLFDAFFFCRYMLANIYLFANTRNVRSYLLSLLKILTFNEKFCSNWVKTFFGCSKKTTIWTSWQLYLMLIWKCVKNHVLPQNVSHTF